MAHQEKEFRPPGTFERPAPLRTPRDRGRDGGMLAAREPTVQRPVGLWKRLILRRNSREGFEIGQVGAKGAAQGRVPRPRPHVIPNDNPHRLPPPPPPSCR